MKAHDVIVYLKALQAAGVRTMLQAQALSQIVRAPGLSNGDLAEMLGVTPSGAHRLVCALERAGLVMKALADGGGVTITATNKGREIAPLQW